MAFLTIQPTPGLSARDRRRASAAGPPGVAVPTSYESLMRSAGFENVTATDVTIEYRATQQRWIDAGERHRDALRLSMGAQAFDDRATNRRATLAAVDEGLLARFLYSAQRRQ